MRASTSLWALAAAQAYAQSSSTSQDSSSSSQSQMTAASTSAPTFDLASSFGSISTLTSARVTVPSGSYASFPTSQMSANTLTSSAATPSSNATSTGSSSFSSTTNTLLLQGSGRTNATSASSTSTAPMSTNTQPCNNYPELCSREYMSFTEVCAHNSAFIRANNAASNQEYSIVSQLNDGVRMIQGETHYVNNSIFSCHTSCDILNAGPLEDELATVAGWVRTHPYDVVTVLLVNSDFRNVSDYVAPIQNSGIAEFLYLPPKVPMHRGDWPTLGNMILSGKRVVLFMDYQANQTEVPYVLDEFSQMWETPYSPTNISFPCTQERPPGLNEVQQDLVPYLANHNLNVDVNLGSTEILIPNFATLDQVNSVNGTANNGSMGSLGEMARTCNQTWGRPPAWLLVDYYNEGNYPGSVFEVAANMNNLTYTRASSCCGENSSSAVMVKPAERLVAVLVALAAVGCTWGLI